MPETRIYRVQGPAPGNKAHNKPKQKENGKGILGHEPSGIPFNGWGILVAQCISFLRLGDRTVMPKTV